MEHRPPMPENVLPPVPYDALRAAIDAEDIADTVTPSAELTGAHRVDDDVVLELVLPIDAYHELGLEIGHRYDLSEVLDDGREVPVIVSASMALTPDETASMLALTRNALRRGGSVALAVDPNADEAVRYTVTTTFEGAVDGPLVAAGDSPAEALTRSLSGIYVDGEAPVAPDIELTGRPQVMPGAPAYMQPAAPAESNTDEAAS